MSTKAPEPPRAFATAARQTRSKLTAVPLRSAPRPSLLARPLTSLEGVGPVAAKQAAKLGIETVGDLLGHLPFDHRDYADARPVAELAIGEEATIAVTVKDCRVRPTRRRRLTILECRVADDTGPLKAVWFNQAYLADQLAPGVRLMLRGKLEGGRGGATFKVSAHELERGGENGSGRHTTGLVPVYPATEGLSARRIRELAFMVRGLEVHAPEPLGARLRVGAALAGKADSIASAHWPESLDEVPVARRRLAFEELFLFQLALVMRRHTRSETREAELLGVARARSCRMARVAAVRADRRAAQGARRDRRRPVDRAPDAPPPDGRGRVGKDRRRPVRDAAGRRGRACRRR